MLAMVEKRERRTCRCVGLVMAMERVAQRETPHALHRRVSEFMFKNRYSLMSHVVLHLFNRTVINHVHQTNSAG